MNITKEIHVSPADNTANPTLRFRVPLGFPATQEIPLSLSGIVRSEKGIIVGTLCNVTSSIHTTGNGAGLWNGPHDLQPRKSTTSISSIEAVLDCMLSDRAITQLISEREMNTKKDSILNLEIYASVLEPQYENVLLGIKEIKVNQNDSKSSDSENTFKVLSVYEDTPFNLIFQNKIYNLVNPDSHGRLATLSNILLRNNQVRIRSSDWIADFCPAFGIGSFIQIELPQFPSLATHPDSAESDNFGARLDEAVSGLEEMKKSIQSGDWRNCLRSARPIYELLNNKEHITDLLLADGFSNEATKSLLDSIESMFTFTSKFIHKVSKGHPRTLQPPTPANKEDALFVYSNAATLINLLLQKHKRSLADSAST